MEDAHNSLSAVKRACDFCKRRKIKCDGNQACSPCLKLNQGNCTYEVPTMKRGPKGARKPNSRGSICSSDEGASKSPFTGSDKSPHNKEKEPVPSLHISDSDSEISPNLYLSLPPDFLNHSLNANIQLSDVGLNLSSSPNQNSCPELYPFLSSLLTASNNFSLFPPEKDVSPNQVFDFELPSREELLRIDYWPVLEEGIDFFSLLLYLDNTPVAKLSDAQIDSITWYLSNFHTRVPILDVDVFLYLLSKPIPEKLPLLLNNLKVLHRLSEIDFAKTDSTLFETWVASLDTYYPSPSEGPFDFTIYVSNATIAKLAILLI